MKSMKLIISILLVISLILTLSACVPRVKVDTGGNLNIQSEDGDIKIGKAKWDGKKMYGLDAPKAELDSYVGTDEIDMYTFSGMKEKDAEAYIDKIKEAGFTYNSVIYEDSNYTGTNKDGIVFSFIYDKESGAGTVAVSQGEKPSEDDNNGDAIIGGTDMKWDSNNVGGLPDPGTQITSYFSVDGVISYSFEGLSDPQEYAEKIKACGFTDEVNEAEVDDTYIFSAVNSNGDMISFTSSSESGMITFERNE